MLRNLQSPDGVLIAVFAGLACSLQRAGQLGPWFKKLLSDRLIMIHPPPRVQKVKTAITASAKSPAPNSPQLAVIREPRPSSASGTTPDTSVSHPKQVLAVARRGCLQTGHDFTCRLRLRLGRHVARWPLVGGLSSPGIHRLLLVCKTR